MALGLVAGAIIFTQGAVAQEPPPGLQRTNPLADDSPCSVGAMYYVGPQQQWQAGVCSPGQQTAYDAEVARLHRLFEINNIAHSSNPCSVNFIDTGKSSTSTGYRPGQAITQPASITCPPLLNVVVQPVDRQGNVVDISLMNGLGVGFDPGRAPYYHYQAVDTNPLSRCYQLTADACLNLLASMNEAPQEVVVDNTPAPALPPERPNDPQPVPAEVNPVHFVPGGICFGLQMDACWAALNSP